MHILKGCVMVLVSAASERVGGKSRWRMDHVHGLPRADKFISSPPHH